MKKTLEKSSYASKEELLRKWRVYSYLVEQDQTEEVIERENKEIQEIESLLPFKDLQEHEHWLDVLQSYKFWEDIEELTMNIINRRFLPSNLDQLLVSYDEVARDVCEDSNFYDLFEVFAKLSHHWVATIDEWEDWWNKLSANEEDTQNFLDLYKEFYEKDFKKEDLWKFYGFETCTHPMFYKDDIEGKSDLMDCIFERYVQGLKDEELLWFYQRLIKELI